MSEKFHCIKTVKHCVNQDENECDAWFIEDLLRILCKNMALESKNLKNIWHRILHRRPCNVHMLKTIFGLTLQDAYSFFALQKCIQKYEIATIDSVSITAPMHAVYVLRRHFLKFFNETFCMLELNALNQIVSIYSFDEGQSSSVGINIRAIIESMLALKSDQFIIAHNHPSGCPKPSLEDIKLTDKLMHMAHNLGLNILDHLILSQNSFYSFKNKEVRTYEQ